MSEKVKVECLRPITIGGTKNDVGSFIEISQAEADAFAKLDPPAVDLESEEDEVKAESFSDNGETIELFSQIEGISENDATQLVALGFDTVEKLKGASVKELQKVNGIGKATAEKLIEELAQIEVEEED